jgi:hypothetical protein
MTLDLENENATGIASKMKISLSLIPESEDSFNRFMETVDANVSRLKSTTEAPASSIISTLGIALQLTKKIMDNIADVCSIIANHFLFLILRPRWVRN